MGAEVTLDYKEQLKSKKKHDNIYGKVIKETTLSSGQKSMWFLQQLSPDNIAYNVYRAVRVTDGFNLDTFEAAWQALVNRHASLRTTFAARHGEPVQRVHESLKFFYTLHNATAMSEKELDDALCRDALRPFDLKNGPLFRISIYQRSKAEFVILFNFHHIITDLWSFAILMGDLGHYYDAISQNKLLKLSPIRTEYAQYIEEQHKALSGEKAEKLGRYWQNVLHGELPVLELKTDEKRPPAQTFVGKAQSTRLDASATRRLNELAKKFNTSVPVVLLAALNVLFYRYTGQEDIIVGTPKAGRTKNTLRTVGFFVNTIPVRTSLRAHQRFVDLLRQVHTTSSAAGEHDALPFSMMLEKIHATRDPSRSPVYQTVFSFQKSSKKVESDGLAYFSVGESGGKMHSGSLVVTSESISTCVAPFDLSVLAAETSNALLLSFQYNADLFERLTIERMLHHFTVLIEGILENPYEFVRHLPIIDENEEFRILKEWNDTFRENPRRHSLKDHFEYIVDQNPDAVAIVDGDTEITFRQLNEKANQIARYLRKKGVGLEVPVAVLMNSSTDLFVGIWAILKAGGAYLPIDPDYPQERIDFMLNDSKVKIVLCHTANVDRLNSSEVNAIPLDALHAEFDLEEKNNLNVMVYPDSLTYLIYTSGSSGKPKGTLLQNRGIGNLVEVQKRLFDVQPTDKILQYASISFDASVWEMVMAHLNGAALVLTPQHLRIEPKKFIEFLRDKQVTSALLPPSFVSMLPKIELPHLRHIITGGEACPPEPVQRWSNDHRFYNAYGPTEATVCATISDVTGSSSANLPIGRPLDNFRLYVLDGELRPVPVGVPGELYISGFSVARGYLNQPALTAIRFLPDPYHPEPGARMYKTGDLVRFLHSGDIEFLDRVDFQVKVRGFRIELDEIKNVLMQHADIKDVFVSAQSENKSATELVVYYTSYKNESIEQKKLATFLKEKLPPFMIPSFFIHMDHFPVTQNGKIDRKSFPVPQKKKQTGRAFAKPKNEQERKIAQVWQAVLRVDTVSRHENFFEIGGHSLLMMKLHAQLEEHFDAGVSVVELFQYPTIAAQAQLISKGQDKVINKTAETRATRQREKLIAQRHQMRNRRTQSARNSSK